MTLSAAAYDPTASYAVVTSEIVYRKDGDTEWPATVYRPDGPGPFPAILRVHGGAWNTGSRLRAAWLDEQLASSGLVIVAIDFRLAPDHPYPAQVADTNYAVRWLKVHAAELGADPSCIGGAGDSSGGHTMMLNAMRPTDPRYAALDQPGTEGLDGSVAYVIALWPVLDPEFRYHYAKRTGYDRLVTSTERYFLTGEARLEGNPQAIAARKEDAVYPPVQVIQGDTDDNIPVEIPTSFEKTYAEAGGHVELEWFPGMPHSFATSPSESADRAVRLIKEFVASRLAACRG